MKWVIQENLINRVDHDRISEICKKHGYGHQSIQVVPFSPDLPDIDDSEPTVFYGGTRFIEGIQERGTWKPGTFFHPGNFTVRAYVEHYGENMFNMPCEFTTIGEFAKSHQPPDKLFFLRPVKDQKEFTGEVMEFNKVLGWERALRHLPGCDNNPYLTTETEIIVSEPHDIAHEWRAFVVEGRVSSGSHYREYLRSTRIAGIPEKVRVFVEALCEKWSPADVFVMDIGESAGNLFVVECGCFNSAGFYETDIEKVIVDVSNYVERKYGEQL